MPGSTEDTEPVIRVRGLRMRYGNVDVLRGLDFDVRAGEVVTLLGPNGAGTSTTVEILEGFRARSAGEVRVLGVDPARADERWRADIGIVLQSWRDHGTWRVRELLTHLGAHYTRYSTPERPRPIGADALLRTVGLADHADRRIAALSGGQRRRLDVAIGIVGRPRLLFLDEPTAGFDPQARRDFHDLVHRLSDDEATTVLLTTHDLAEAERLADRGLLGWTALGLLACLPLGMLVGSVVRNPRTIGGIGFLATTGLALVSGLFSPLQAMWGWVQVLAQVLPVYRLGAGLRAVFLPPEAAALEVGGTWRALEAVGVLGAWSAVGLLLGPALLRRMARRESGSAVEARRQRALQRA